MKKIIFKRIYSLSFIFAVVVAVFGIIYVVNSTTIGTDISTTNLTISGNVGIGTTTPSAKLDVVGRISQTGLGYSTFVGYQAGQNDDLSNNYNTAFGYQSLYSNATGTYNTANGYKALYTNNGGRSNTAIGNEALINNTMGDANTAIGVGALYDNTTGEFNTASGAGALGFNTTGSYNAANGYETLSFNTTGNYNTVYGYRALYYSQTGSNNTVIGGYAGFGTTNYSFSSSTIIGYYAGASLTTGSANLLLGFNTGGSLTTGSRNIIIGYNTDTPTSTTSDFLNIGDVIYGDLSTGKVGIGTTTPATALHLYKTASTTLMIGASNKTACIIMGDSDGSGLTYVIANDGVLTATTTKPSICE